MGGGQQRENVCSLGVQNAPQTSSADTTTAAHQPPHRTTHAIFQQRYPLGTGCLGQITACTWTHSHQVIHGPRQNPPLLYTRLCLTRKRLNQLTAWKCALSFVRKRKIANSWSLKFRNFWAFTKICDESHGQFLLKALRLKDTHHPNTKPIC